MIIRFTRTITLSSGNEARNFRFHSLGYGRVEFITARSARGGRVEFFSTYTIINELLEMLSEFNEATQDVAQHRYAPAKVEETETEQKDTDLLDTLKMVGGHGDD